MGGLEVNAKAADNSQYMFKN